MLQTNKQTNKQTDSGGYRVAPQLKTTLSQLQDFSKTTSRITLRQLKSTQLGTTRLKSCFIIINKKTDKESIRY